MKPLRRSQIVVGVIAVGLAAAAIAVGALPGQPAGPAAPAAAVVTAFPGLVAPTGEPTLTSLQSLRPAAGAVVQADGPFDDRFELDQLAFDGTTVSGTVAITSDVSDVLELEVVAGFYGADGALLGTGRFVHHATGDEQGHTGPPSESEPFEIAVPTDLPQRAVSVGVGVPVLVNE